MFKFSLKDVGFFLLLLIIAIGGSYFLTMRYFALDPDSANSPLVWRAFLTEGFSAFKDWAPTPDNWYFTTYPVNFLFFALMGNDGIHPLVLSTSVFVGLSAFILACVVYRMSNAWHALIAAICLILLPAYVYTFGFAAHPFSHYSTNFFGILVFALAFFNIKKKSLPLTWLTTFIALFASISDPWFLATYFLPLLLTCGYFSWRQILPRKFTIILGISFIISMSHMLQRLMGLPIQRFKLMPVAQWPDNAAWVVQLLGKSLNLFFVHTPLAYIASFVIWMALFLYAVIICLRKGTEAVFVSLFSFFTASAIISSFIISYDFPADISARFFVGAVCFAIVMVVLAFSCTKKVAIALVFPLYIASSLYSYQVNTTPLYDQEKQTYDYIAFLKKNNLTFGYGDYWKLSNNVNWLSFGEIHISPVMFDKVDFHIQFDSTRSQTLRSWLTDAYVQNSPDRQFVAIPAVETETSPHPRLEAVRAQLGKPDETLLYADMTIFVYHHRLPLR